jgi:hypothetical protein
VRDPSEIVPLGVLFGHLVRLNKLTREIFWDTDIGRTCFSVDHPFIKTTALHAAALNALGEEQAP